MEIFAASSFLLQPIIFSCSSKIYGTVYIINREVKTFDLVGEKIMRDPPMQVKPIYQKVVKTMLLYLVSFY